MASDFLAASYSMMLKHGTAWCESNAPEPPRGEAGLSFLKLSPDSLRKIKENYEAERQRQVDEWRKRKAAQYPLDLPS
jgi:hypothetical protein